MNANAKLPPGLLERAAFLASQARDALRFVATDRIGGMILIWALLAFVARPLLIGAHEGDASAAAAWLRSRTDAFALARLTGIAEWLSFALLLALMAVTHVRVARFWPTERQAQLSLFAACAYAVALPAAFMVFLWSKATVVTLMAHDTFIFADAAHRIQYGQIPSVDFHTPIGAVALYGAAFGTWLSGGYAGSIEIVSALVSLVLGLACAYVCKDRLPSSAASLLVILVFMTATPMGLLSAPSEGSVTVVNDQVFVLTDNLTHAMFYNRWGWAALIVAFAFLAPRAGQASRLAEILIFAGILTFLFYLKLSYFLAGFAAAVAFAVLSGSVFHTLVIGGGATVAGVLLVGLPSGLLPGYLTDVAQAASISADRFNALAPILRLEMLSLLVSIAPFALIAYTDRLNRNDWLAASVMLIGSLFVITQNTRAGYICSLIGLSAYGVARCRTIDAPLAKALALAMFVLLAAPPALERLTVLMDRSAAIRREEARPPSSWSGMAALERIYIPERESVFGLVSNAQSDAELAVAVSVAGSMKRRQGLRQGEYMATLMAGVDELRSVMAPGESVVALDMSNPFPMLLDARSAHGDWLSLDKGRTISEEVHPDATDLFSDADHVMIARVSMLQSTADLADELYGEWLSENYEITSHSAFWTRYSGRKDGS